MAITAKFESDFSDFDKGVKGAQKNLVGLEASSEKAATALGGMEKQTSVLGFSLGQLAAGFTVGAVVRFATGVIEAGAALNDLSERTGISVEALQQWGNIAEQSGTSAEALAKAAFTLSKALAGDNESVQKAVKALGLDLQALRDMTPEERLKTVATALSAMKDPLQQAAAGAALLGKGMDELKPALTALATTQSSVITYTKDQTTAMAALANMATTAKNSIGPLTVTLLDHVLSITKGIKAWQTFFDTINNVVPPVANATAHTQEWNKAIDDRAAKPLTITLKEEKKFIEESNAAVKQSVEDYKAAAEIRAFYNMVGEREIELIAKVNEARAKDAAALRDYYNFVGERRMEDDRKAQEWADAQTKAFEQAGQAAMDAAVKEEQARFAAQGVGEAAKEVAPAVDLATGSVLSAGTAAQQTAGSFFQMSAGLYDAIRAAQQWDALGGADRNIYGSTIGGIGGSSASTRYMGAANTRPPVNINITINGSVLGNKDEIARVVGDAVTSSYRSGGNRLPV